MRYYEIITEGRSQVISEHEFRAMLPDYSDILSKKSIYRGIDISHDTEFLKVDPKTEKLRRSANSANYVTLFVDNEPEWSEFPKRSQSLICSVDVNVADGYGNVFRVLPKNGSKIGVCPANDWWLSFKKLGRSDIEHLNWELGTLFTKNNITKSDDTFERFMTSLNKVDFSKFDQEDFHIPLVDKETLLNHLHNSLDPVANKFKLQTTADFKPYQNSEVWTDGDSIMVNTHLRNYKKYLK